MRLHELIPDAGDDDLVNLGRTARNTVRPRSYWFRWGDVKHLTIPQMQTLIGDLASAGVSGSVRFVRVADRTSARWQQVSGIAGYTEHVSDDPVGVTRCVPIGDNL